MWNLVGRAVRYEKRRPHDPDRPQAVAEEPREGRGEERSGSVEEKDRRRGSDGEAETPRQVQHQEGEHHRARLVDECGRREHPDRARHGAQSAPRVDAMPGPAAHA